MAQLPTPNDVPGRLAEQQRAELERARAVLLTTRESLVNRVQTHNAKCGSVPEGSVAARECAEARQWLQAEIADYSKATGDFNKTVMSAKPAGASSESGITTAIDPRNLITAGEYQSAKRNLAKLRDLEKRLNAKREQLRDWRGDLDGYRREFETLRAESANISLSEVLAAVPLAEVLDIMSTIEKYRWHLTPQRVDRLKAAYQGLKAAIEGAEVLRAKSDIERLRKTLGAATGVRQALVEFGLSNLPAEDEGRAFAQRMDQSLRIFAVTSVFLVEQSRSGNRATSVLEGIGAWVNPAAEVGGIVYPPLGVGIAVKQVAEKSRRAVIIRAAIDELATALGTNWNAERYLERKIEQVRRDADLVSEILDRYERLHTPATRQH